MNHIHYKPSVAIKSSEIQHEECNTETSNESILLYIQKLMMLNPQNVEEFEDFQNTLIDITTRIESLETKLEIEHNIIISFLEYIISIIVSQIPLNQIITNNIFRIFLFFIDEFSYIFYDEHIIDYTIYIILTSRNPNKLLYSVLCFFSLLLSHLSIYESKCTSIAFYSDNQETHNVEFIYMMVYQKLKDSDILNYLIELFQNCSNFLFQEMIIQVFMNSSLLFNEDSYYQECTIKLSNLIITTKNSLVYDLLTSFYLKFSEYNLDFFVYKLINDFYVILEFFTDLSIETQNNILKILQKIVTCTDIPIFQEFYNIDFHNFIIGSKIEELTTSYLKLIQNYAMKYGFDKSNLNLHILEDLFVLSDSEQPYRIEKQAIICILFLICTSTQELISLFVNEFNIIQKMIYYYDKGDLYVRELLSESIPIIQQYLQNNKIISSDQLVQCPLIDDMVFDVILELNSLIA